MSICNSTRAASIRAHSTLVPVKTSTRIQSLIVRMRRTGPFPPSFPRLYRAHVEPSENGRCPERTAFVEAAGHRDAIRKIANAVAALEGCSPETVMENRIYNCVSAHELIDDGVSEDLELRIFETGSSGNTATSFVQQPLFLLAAPAPLIRKWAQIVEVSHVGI